MTINQLIEKQNKLACNEAEAKALVARLSSTPPTSLEDVAAMQTAKVRLFDLEIDAADNAIKLCDAQQAKSPEKLAKLEAAFEASIEEVRALLAEAGITVNEMPSVGIDAKAAERQLLNGFIMASSIVRGAKAEVVQLSTFEKQSKEARRRLATNLEQAEQNKQTFFSKMVG